MKSPMPGDTPMGQMDRLGRVRAQLLAGFACAALLSLLSACSDSSLVLDAASKFVAEASSNAAAATALDGSAVVTELADVGAAGTSERNAASQKTLAASTEKAPAAGVRTYFQFIEETGSVRFVDTLEDVPAKWRDRAGRVELASAPPLRPADRAAELAARRERARTVLAATRPDESRSSRSQRLDADVQLYYATWCGYCRKVKAHLENRGIDYVLRDVDEPETKAELVSRTGSSSIPVLDVGGELVHGYDPVSIDRLLAKL